jgi:hypothetical protein
LEDDIDFKNVCIQIDNKPSNNFTSRRDSASKNMDDRNDTVKRDLSSSSNMSTLKTINGKPIELSVLDRRLKGRYTSFSDDPIPSLLPTEPTDESNKKSDRKIVIINDKNSKQMQIKLNQQDTNSTTLFNQSNMNGMFIFIFVITPDKIRDVESMYL